MSEIARSLHELNAMDTLAGKDSPVHRIDPRAKVITFVVFAGCVVSFRKYEVSALLPYFLFPAVILPLGRIPMGFLARKVLLVLPIAVLIGIFNPIFDRTVLFSVAGLGVSGGMVSFTSILLRFVLTVVAALMLVAVTGFNGICATLERFGVPRAFSVQLMMLYRYLFVLTAEGVRMSRARELRSVGRAGTGLRDFSALIGHLLLRTWHRAQRIHMAMLSRCFRGEFFLRRPMRLGSADIVFTLAWSSAFIVMRLVNMPQAVGRFLLEVFP
ncbi:MAG TPA: cobalt ECF transporter T component CbiQ [Deltaproteobacteria bacterium]|nr:cobalt ECF transporter T component CbiQ [Deltaproteobacteria bacterium]HQI81023.1 cobalt ECF transporter T component CbiQ [Deltaproteobacteria bacterium]